MSQKLPYYFLIFVGMICWHDLNAVKIVRLEIEYGSDIYNADWQDILAGDFDIPKFTGSIDLELYDVDAPLTVNNFLQYVNGGLYDQTFFYRSVPGLILQTGGLRSVTTDPEAAAGSAFQSVPGLGTVLNEPGRSNVRGTIAMARIAGQENSAEKEWYINVADNSDPLDRIDNGFTVFGSVIDNGMDIVDNMASFPVVNSLGFLGSAYGVSTSEFPFADLECDFSNCTDTVRQQNLLMIQRITEITRPVLRFSPGYGNLGFDVPPGDLQGPMLDVEVYNTGNVSMRVVNIDTAGLPAEISIDSETCTSAVLQPVSDPIDGSCVITFRLVASSIGNIVGEIVVVYEDAVTNDAYSVRYELQGEGSNGAPVLDVNATLNIGAAQVNGPGVSSSLVLKNSGEASLSVSDITISDGDFTISDDCTGLGVIILPGSSCVVDVSFKASTFGQKNAALSIYSNDPVKPVARIDISASGEDDTDGVPTSIELAVNSAGDGNNDAVKDSVQNNVASILNKSDYVTIISEDGALALLQGEEAETMLSDVVIYDVVAKDYPGDASDSVKLGFNVRTADNGIVGESVRVGVLLPVGIVGVNSYRYGPTPDNRASHWYDFNYDADKKIGARYVGEVKGLRRALVLISMIDGQFGDDDLVADGRISHAVAVLELIRAKSDGFGSMSWGMLMAVSLFMFVLRRRKLG